MDTQIVVVFCLCDDMLKALHHHEDPQCRMSDAEVMTTAIVAMLYFRGNFCLASRFLYDGKYIPGMLSKSRFNRRLHRIADLFLTLFLRLGQSWKMLNERSTYIIDSYPIAVCDNYRIQRSNIYTGEAYRGYIPSKKRYFYGVRIHIMTTETGEPVEFFLAPGAFSDTSALALYNFYLPKTLGLSVTKLITITPLRMFCARLDWSSFPSVKRIRCAQYHLLCCTFNRPSEKWLKPQVV